MTTRKELGEILLEADLISPSQLDEALGLQQAYGERLASVLVRKRILTEKFAVTYLARQLGVAGMDFSRTEIDLGPLELLPLDLCERHLIFPVRVAGDRLHVAMMDPGDRVLITRIEGKTGLRLVPMVALESSIKNAIQAARRALAAGARTISPMVPGAVAAAGPSHAGPSTEAADAVAGHASAGARTASEPDRAQPTGGPALVLAALGEGAIRGGIEELLGAHGIGCTTIGLGDDPLGEARKRRPQLVILDSEIEGLDAVAVCREIKQSQDLRETAVLLLVASGLGWRFAADLRDHCGADDVMERACALPELFQRIEVLIHRTPAGMAAAGGLALRQLLRDGVVALKQGQPVEAVTVLRRGLAIDPSNDLLHYYLGMAFEKTGQFLPAAEHYERAVHANPDFYDAIISLANMYERQQFRRKAAELWGLALAGTHDEGVRARLREHLLTLL